MAVTAAPYGLVTKTLAQGEVDLANDTLKVLLVDDSYTPDLDAHQYLDDITGEITGSGYTAGGATLASVTVTYNAGTDTLKIDAADVSWDPSTISAYAAILYDDTPVTDATKPLLGIVDFGEEMSSANDEFTITWDETGILLISVV